MESRSCRGPWRRGDGLGDRGAGAMAWGGPWRRGTAWGTVGGRVTLLCGAAFCLLTRRVLTHLATCFSDHGNSSHSGACLLISFPSFTPFPPFSKSSKIDFFEYLLVVTLLFSFKNKSRKCLFILRKGPPPPDWLLPVGLEEGEVPPFLALGRFVSLWSSSESWELARGQVPSE